MKYSFLWIYLSAKLRERRSIWYCSNIGDIEYILRAYTKLYDPGQYRQYDERSSGNNEKYQKEIDKLQEQTNGSSKEANITSRRLKMATGQTSDWRSKHQDEEVLLACVFSFKYFWVQKWPKGPPSVILERESYLNYWKSGLQKGQGLPWAEVRRRESLVAIPHEQVQIHSFTLNGLTLF